MRDEKRVPIKQMKVGDTFRHLVHPNGTTMASFEVVEMSGAFCKLKIYDRIETWSTEGLYAEVPLSDEEFKAKYKTHAADLIERLKHEITDLHEIGVHEMWNSWIDTDIYEFAANCVKNKIEVLGWFDLGDDAREFVQGMTLDIGIVARDEDSTFWCHARKQWIDHMMIDWEEESNKEV